MKITTKLTLEYIKKNKRRSMVTIVRNNYCNSACHCSPNTFIKLSRIYGKYS